MFNHAETQQDEAVRQCPVCGNTFPPLPASPQFDAPCADCGSYLWCSKHSVGEAIVLEAMPDRTPALWDVEQVLDAIFKGGPVKRVIFNMTHLNFVSSALVARLVVMNRKIKAAGCEFILCEMHPIVHEAFETFQLVQAFTVMDTEEEAASM